MLNSVRKSYCISVLDYSPFPSTLSLYQAITESLAFGYFFHCAVIYYYTVKPQFVLFMGKWGVHKRISCDLIHIKNVNEFYDDEDGEGYYVQALSRIFFREKLLFSCCITYIYMKCCEKWKLPCEFLYITFT